MPIPNWLKEPPPPDILRMDGPERAFFALPPRVRELIHAYALNNWGDGVRCVIDIPRIRVAEVEAAYRQAQCAAAPSSTARGEGEAG